MTNPYLLDLPAVVNFSGGRSSGFMLYKIWEAFDFNWPDNCVVIFNNTGHEHPETYNFIHRVSEKWKIPVTWIEYDVDFQNMATFKEVDFYSASRKGEPFETLINKRGYLPNPLTRMCTNELKIKLTERYVKTFGWKEWDNAVGLRADEARRVAKAKPRLKRIHLTFPMYEAGHDKQDVKEFWDQHKSVDLRLPHDSDIYGNCVCCFLKGYAKVERIAREYPESFEWWIKMEKKTGNTFRVDRPDYQTIKDNAHKQLAFDFGDTIDCYCTD
tara:strand:- start:4 stop:816 length:813 start_codon:yes stop_codon:yes gene_type:complete